MGPLKSYFGLEPVQRYKPSIYQPISHCAIGASMHHYIQHFFYIYFFLPVHMIKKTPVGGHLVHNNIFVRIIASMTCFLKPCYGSLMWVNLGSNFVVVS